MVFNSSATINRIHSNELYQLKLHSKIGLTETIVVIVALVHMFEFKTKDNDKTNRLQLQSPFFSRNSSFACCACANQSVFSVPFLSDIYFIHRLVCCIFAMAIKFKTNDFLFYQQSHDKKSPFTELSLSWLFMTFFASKCKFLFWKIFTRKIKRFIVE